MLLAATPAVAAGPEDDDTVVVDDDEGLDDDLDGPDEATDEEAPQPTSSKAPASAPASDDAGPSASGSASVSVGGGAKAKGKSGKPKKKVQSCHSKPFDIFDCTPDDHQIEFGFHTGAWITAKNHGLFEPGQTMGSPSLRRGNANFGLRLFYLPIEYIGVGFETTFMPTMSPSEDALGNVGDALLYTVRGFVAGQAPWRITPTFLMGGGLLAIKSDNPIFNSGEGFFYYGPGGKFYVWDWIALRVEGRHIVSANDRGRVHHGEIFAAVDLTLRVGKWLQQRADRKYRDQDKDGWIDEDDKCPTLYGEDDQGCPADVDSDRDGTPDKRDRCPEEYGDGPGGCPTLDKDGDGIIDTQDSCPDEPETYNGFDDGDGCKDEEPAEIKQISGVMEGIQFASGKSTIKKDSHAILDNTADILQRYPQIRIKITGYTDDKGKAETNEKLSQDRADAVKAYFVGKGIAEDRLETEGKGPDNPIADNGTEEGRAKNRRIEFARLPDGEAPPADKL